jgi:hypothetical protein
LERGFARGDFFVTGLRARVLGCAGVSLESMET